MKQKITLLIYAITTFVALVLSAEFGSYYETKIEDLSAIRGIVKGELKVLKDEQGSDVGLRFHLEGQAITYSLAGKLLRLADSDIYQLKAGDQVLIWHRKEAAKSFLGRVFGRLDGVWGIEQIGGKILLAKETALEQRKSPQSLVFMSLFIMMAAATSYLFYRKIRRLDA